MTLRDDVQLRNTREKLRELEERYAELQHESGGNAHVRQLTMFSLKRLINQLKEEIARYNAHQTAQR